MKFATCNEMFEGWDFDRICRVVKGAGYDGLELAPFTLATPITDLSGRRRDNPVCADAEHEAVALQVERHLHGPTHSVHHDVAIPNGSKRLAGRARRRLPRSRRFGHGVRLAPQRSRLLGVSPDDAFAWAVETLSWPCPWPTPA